jgi:hypothetical protein
MERYRTLKESELLKGALRVHNLLDLLVSNVLPHAVKYLLDDVLGPLDAIKASPMVKGYLIKLRYLGCRLFLSH